MSVALALLLLPPSAHAQIVALGASNTEGLGVGVASAYPAQLEAMLRARGRDVRVINAGVSGDTTRDLLRRLDRDVPAGTRIVILSGREAMSNNPHDGITPAQGQADIAAMMRRLEAGGITVVPVVTGALPARYRQADHAHLTVEGHRLIAVGLLPQILKALGP